MVDYDKDFIFYDDTDDDLVDVSKSVNNTENKNNSKGKNDTKHSDGARHYADIVSYEEENPRKKNNGKKADKKDGKTLLRTARPTIQRVCDENEREIN